MKEKQELFKKIIENFNGIGIQKSNDEKKTGEKELVGTCLQKKVHKQPFLLLCLH